MGFYDYPWVITVYFKFLDVYTFQDNNNMLTLKAGSLPFVPNRKYGIFSSTTYYNITYYQYTIINIEPPPQLPISIIR